MDILASVGLEAFSDRYQHVSLPLLILLPLKQLRLKHFGWWLQVATDIDPGGRANFRAR